MTKDAFMRSVVVATPALLWASPRMAQPTPAVRTYLRLNGTVPPRSASRN